MKFLSRWYVAFLLILFGVTGAYFVEDPVSDFLPLRHMNQSCFDIVSRISRNSAR